jgi:hypothetical protein
MRRIFFWSKSAHHTEVCWFHAMWDLLDGNEADCVGALDGAVAASEAVYFSCVRGPPEGALTAAAELFVFRNLTSVRVERIAVERPM